MNTSGDCVIPHTKSNAINDSAVELDKDGDNIVKEDSEKNGNWIESEDHTGNIISQQTNYTEVYFTENEFERTSHDYSPNSVVVFIESQIEYLLAHFFDSLQKGSYCKKHFRIRSLPLILGNTKAET